MQPIRFHILSVLLIAVFLSFVHADMSAAQEKTFTVVIDAGHGGHDSGAVGQRGKEKDINLKVALKLGNLIQNNCKDTKVVYTRSKDVFIPLYRRAEIANNAKADLFISIHTNSIGSRNSQIRGTETYTLGLHRTEDNLDVAKKENSVILIEDDYKQQYAGFDPNSSESYIIFEFMQNKNMSQSVNFATLVQRQFRQGKRVDKGVHQAGFLVLRATSMPSVLIELGYITNREEEAYLLSESGTSNLANCIYKAFADYRSNHKPDGIKDGIKAGKAETPSSVAETGKPVFKIQILASKKLLPKGSREFKGLSPIDHYEENGMIKYTYGADTDYNKILRLKRSKVDGKFNDAFIVAFRNGKKMNTNQAIKEFMKK